MLETGVVASFPQKMGYTFTRKWEWVGEKHEHPEARSCRFQVTPDGTGALSAATSTQAT